MARSVRLFLHLQRQTYSNYNEVGGQSFDDRGNVCFKNVSITRQIFSKTLSTQIKDKIKAFIDSSKIVLESFLCYRFEKRFLYFV